MAPPLRSMFSELRSLRGIFGPDAEARRFQLLRALLAAAMQRAQDAGRLHDELLFAAAFPDSMRIRSLAEAALLAFTARIRRLTATERRKLSDSGIAGTVTTSAFNYGAAQWLVKHKERVRIDWPATPNDAQLDELLRMTLVPAEADAFESGDLSGAQWTELASGRPRAEALAWLLAAAPERAIVAGDRSWRDAYEAVELKCAWHHGASPRSVSRNRAPVRKITVRRAFRAPPENAASHIVKPLAGIKLLRTQAAARWHDACVAALTARGREVLPTIYANRDEIYLAPLGDGVELCVLGVASEDRLALEANYGYVMFANGIPIGYGGVTSLGAQANTGINIFESFRHGEAAFLFAQAMRAFRTLFGCTRFIVNPYQIGANNNEAIESGAYWFYHRLGFRPVEAKLAALAERERARNMSRPGRRSSTAALRRLASANLMLELPGASKTVLFDESWLAIVSRAVAEYLRPFAAGARLAHIEALSRDLCHSLTGRRRALRADERAGAVYLAPIIALVRSKVESWPAAERAALWQLLRRKGQRTERPFARASRAHGKWWRTLADDCRRRCEESG